MSRLDIIKQMTVFDFARFLLEFKNTFGEEYEGEMSLCDWLNNDGDVWIGKEPHYILHKE